MNCLPSQSAFSLASMSQAVNRAVGKTFSGNNLCDFFYKDLRINISFPLQHGRLYLSFVHTVHRITFAKARKSYRTGHLFAHKNGNSATEQSYAAPALKWRDTYPIGFHTIMTRYSFSCQHEKTIRFDVNMALIFRIVAESLKDLPKEPFSRRCSL